MRIWTPTDNWESISGRLLGSRVCGIADGAENAGPRAAVPGHCCCQRLTDPKIPIVSPCTHYLCAIMRVFWPTNIERRTGTAVGWRLPPAAGDRTEAPRKETLVVVDVVEVSVQPSSSLSSHLSSCSLQDNTIPSNEPPFENLARVVAPSEPAADSDGLTIWADRTPTAYSIPAETILFTPSQRLVLPSEEGKEAEYGATVRPSDLRALLESVCALFSSIRWECELTTDQRCRPHAGRAARLPAGTVQDDWEGGRRHLEYTAHRRARVRQQTHGPRERRVLRHDRICLPRTSRVEGDARQCCGGAPS
jgi:hypothetical protein